jgi:competence protein ComEA
MVGVDLHALTPMQRRLIVAAAVVVLAVWLALRHFSAARPAAIVPPLRAPATAPRTRAELIVDVAGAVRRPGVYRLTQGMRIADAVARAGGATRKADLAALNLAAPLADGEQVLVPRRGAAAAAPAGAGAASPTAPVDLNTASVEQLDALPGIGPTTAQKIVDYRQTHGAFHSLQDLDAVPGIGPGRIEQLKGLAIP